MSVIKLPKGKIILYQPRSILKEKLLSVNTENIYFS